MIRYDDNIYIAGLQSLYNVGATYVRRFIEDFGSPYDAWQAIKNVENLKSYTYISASDKRAISASLRWTLKSYCYCWSKELLLIWSECGENARQGIR